MPILVSLCLCLVRVQPSYYNHFSPVVVHCNPAWSLFTLIMLQGITGFSNIPPRDSTIMYWRSSGHPASLAKSPPCTPFWLNRHTTRLSLENIGMQDGVQLLDCWCLFGPNAMLHYSLLLYKLINLVIDAIDNDQLDWEGVTNQGIMGFWNRLPTSVSVCPPSLSLNVSASFIKKDSLQITFDFRRSLETWFRVLATSLELFIDG